MTEERIYVVDVSSVQPYAGWPTVAAHDPGAAFGAPPGRIRGAIVKATEGRGGIDPEARQHLEGAQGAGLTTGIYHFSRAGAGPAREQADRVLDQKHDLGDDPGELPVWLDCEEKGIAARLGGPNAYVDWILAWHARVVERGFRGGIYTAPVYGPEWAGASADRLGELAQLLLWIAQYTRIGPWVPADGQSPMKLAPWGDDYDLWQFSGGGPGLPGNTVKGFGPNYVDLNLVKPGRWLRLLGKEPVEPTESGGPTIHPRVPLGRPALDD